MKIGDFSKIAKVSVRMLRHYDQIGLLKPMQVDAESFYRSYSIEQLGLLNRIIFLKDIGFSLNEINGLIDSNISVSEMKSMLVKRQKNIENEILIAQLSLNTVMDRLRNIELEGEIPRYDINVKSTQEFMVASIRQIVSEVRHMTTYCQSVYSNLYSELTRGKVSWGRLEITFYHNEEYNETDLDVEFGVVVSDEGTEFKEHQGSEFHYRKITAEEKVAYLIYNGSFEGVEGAVIELLKWTATNHWEIAGEVRELHLSGPAHLRGEVQEHATIELQVPVKRAPEIR